MSEIYRPIDPVRTGMRLRSKRQVFNLTQEGLCEAFFKSDMEISPQSISAWENGHKIPTTEHIRFLAWLYHCTMEELIVEQRVPDDSDQLGHHLNMVLLGHTNQISYVLFLLF